MTSSATEPIPAAPAESSHGALDRGYRPHLDGLRAVAVYLVVAFHAGTSRFDGGYIGVDVFFVLSGYLVTQVLLRDLRGSGSINLKRFYARRFRRLLPAVFAMLVITAAIYPAVASTAEVLDAVDAFRAAFLYSANWFFIGQSTDYFGADINQSPVLHVWSLAVEEQFYLTWPLLLTGLYMVFRRTGRRQWSFIRSAVALGGLASLGLTFHYAGSDLNRAYFGTDARAYQLLAGAMLALTPRVFDIGKRGQRWLRPIAPVALLAIIVIGSSSVTLGPIGRGVAATIATVSLLVAIESTDHDLAKRVLSGAPIVYLGRISYGTYLWQWPIVIIATHVVTLGSTALFALTCLLATALASLSFQLLERPVRESTFLEAYARPVIILGVVGSLLGGLFIVPRMLDRDGSRLIANATSARSGVALVPADLDWRRAREEKPPFPYCIDEEPEACVLVHGTGPHVMLMGDSFAATLIGTFEEVARRHSLTFSVAIAPACPWQMDLYYPLWPDKCREYKDDWYERVLPALTPDVFVLFDASFDDPLTPIGPIADDRGSKYAFGTAEYNELVRATSQQTVARLRRESDHVVIIEPIPAAPAKFDSAACLSSATYFEECRFVASDVRTASERVYGEAAGGDVSTLDLDRLVCPYLPICDPAVNGLVVRGDDDGHLSVGFANSLAGPIADLLRRNGVIRD